MNTVYFTEELGTILRSFRQTYKKTAVNVADSINKKAPYLSKLESGQVKKMDASDFIKMCNYITGTQQGIVFFIDTAFRKDNLDYTDDTLITLTNIDEVLYRFPTPEKLVQYLSQYVNEHNITLEEIIKEINSNNDIVHHLPQEFYNNMLPNLWYMNPDNQGYSIKLEIPQNMIYDFFSGDLAHTNYIFLYALLYSVYKLSNIPSEQAHRNATETLKKHDVFKLRNQKHITKKDLPNIFGDLDPQVEQDLAAVLEALKLVLYFSQTKGGNKRISNIKNNLSKDLGYAFAFMSTDISTICDLSRERKLDFLKDLKSLVDKYTSYKDTDIDLFLDE